MLAVPALPGPVIVIGTVKPPSLIVKFPEAPPTLFPLNDKFRFGVLIVTDVAEEPMDSVLEMVIADEPDPKELNVTVPAPGSNVWAPLKNRPVPEPVADTVIVPAAPVVLTVPVPDTFKPPAPVIRIVGDEAEVV